MSLFGLFGRRGKDPIDTIPLDIRRRLMEWLKAFATISSGRRYLENHLELLRDESEQFFTIIISRSTDDPELVRKLRTSRELVHTSRVHGGTKESVGDAFIDEFGAFAALDLLPWLETLRKQLDHGINVANLIPLLRDAIARSRSDPSVLPEIAASLQVTLAEILQNEAEEDYSEIIELALSALQVFPRSRFPVQFARVQGLLGSAYFLQGSKTRDVAVSENQDVPRAIESFKATLTVLTPDLRPDDWGQAQMRLGLAYDFKGALRCAELHLTKALQVFTEEDNPNAYNMIQHRLEELSMELLERKMKLDGLSQVMDEDMIEGIRRRIEAADEDCANEL